MIVSLEGEEKTGKTTFAYTSPLKVVGFQFDIGHERALNGARFDQFSGLKIEVVEYQPMMKEPEIVALFTGDWDILIFELPQPLQIDQIQVMGKRELWSYFLVRLGFALREDTVRSIVIDTMTLARRVKVDAYLQALQEKEPQKLRVRLQQIEYGVPNDAIRDIYTGCASVGKNLIATHHLTDEYQKQIGSSGVEESNKTGKRVLEGLAGTNRLVDLAIRMDKKDAGVISTITTCGFNLALEGLPLMNPTWNSTADTIEASLAGRIQIEKKEVPDAV